METKNVKFTSKELIQLAEVNRRVEKFKGGDKNAPMVYLGFPSEVKTLVEKGILTPYGGRETKGALNWYNLTEAGKRFI